MMDVDGSSRPAESQLLLKLFGLVWGLPPTGGWCPICIQQMNRVNSHNGCQHHKHCQQYTILSSQCSLKRVWQNTRKHPNWTWRMPWIVVDGGSWWRMSDEQDGCEWVTVSSRISSPRQSQTKGHLTVVRVCVYTEAVAMAVSCLYLPSRFNWYWSKVMGSLRCLMLTPTLLAAASWTCFISSSRPSSANTCCHATARYSVKCVVIDRVVVLRPTRYKTGHFGLVRKMTRPSSTKFTNQKKRITTQNKHKKLKPGSVTFCDIRPGNGAGLLSKEKINKGGDKSGTSKDKRISGSIPYKQSNNIYSKHTHTHLTALFLGLCVS